MDEVALNTVLRYFLLQYKNFDQSCSPAIIGDKVVLMLFGVSKAGKSAFMARLLSDKSGPEFLSSLPVDGADRNIEGVTVGSSINSTTIFPKITKTKIHDLLVCDMPGLKDTNNNNKGIISILHKCLFKRVTKAKMLIVVDITTLSNHASSVAEEYYTELDALFGAYYEVCLDSCYFVLTHADLVSSSEAILSTLPKKVMQLLAKKNTKTAQFFTRLESTHMVVNYREFECGAFFDKLLEWIQCDDVMNPQEFQHIRLLADANVINLNCVESLKKRIKDEESSEPLESIRNNSKERRDEFFKTKEKLQADILSQESAIAKKDSDINTTQRAIEKLVVDIMDVELKKKEAVEQEDEALEDVKQVKQVLSQQLSVDYFRFKSTEVKIRTSSMGSTKIMYQLTAVVSKHESEGDYRAIVCTNHETFMSICQQVSLSGSLNLGHIANEGVRFNNAINSNDPDITIENHKDEFKVQVLLAEPFEVLLAYQIMLRSTPAVVLFRETQERKAKKANALVKSLSDELVLLVTDKNSKESSLLKLKSSRSDQDDKLNRLKNTLVEKTVSYKAQMEEFRVTVDEKYQALLKIKNGTDDVINNMKSISEILKDNSLDYDMNDKVGEYETLVASNISNVEKVLGYLDHLLAIA